MIVGMKKASLIVLAGERDQVLGELRDLGLLHIESGKVRGENFDRLQNELARLERAVRLLPLQDKSVASVGGQRHKAVEVLKALEGISERREEIGEELERIGKEMDRIREWGAFDPAGIRELREKGVDLRLYVVPTDLSDRLSEAKAYFRIAGSKSATYVAAVPDAEGLAGLPEFPLPQEGLPSLQARRDELVAEQHALQEKLAGYASATPVLEQERARLASASEFEKARLSMGEAEGLLYLTGYLPTRSTEMLRKRAASQGWGLLLRDPDPEDPVPSLIKNPKPVGIIRPVFHMLGTVPGYREFDISLWFLLFFALFFAMIIGDAGYGFLFLAVSVTFMIRNVSKKKPPGTFLVLITVLSVGLIVWGALSGTWFGSKAISEHQPFRSLVVPAIYSFSPQSSATIKYMCFVIGTIQIIIAHLWNFIRAWHEKPRIRAFAQLGWVSIMVAIFYLVLDLVLDPSRYPLPHFAIWLIVGGFAAIVIFSQQEGNFFKGIARGIAGLLTTFLSGISAFADVISYIRLFAVGLATVEIAKSFNGMAAQAGHSVVGIIGAVVILLFGHSLNIALGALALIVHGVRLNMLEFSGHLGMGWSGIPYAPFKKVAGVDETT